MWERSVAAAAARQGIFPAPRGHDPPPAPFQMVAAAGASQWESLSKKAAGGRQLSAASGGGSAPRRRGQQPRGLQRCHLSGSPRSLRCPPRSPAGHLGNVGRAPRAPGEPPATTGGASEPPAQRLPRSGGGRRGKSRLPEPKVLPGTGHTWCCLSSAPTWVGVSRGPASEPAPGAPPSPDPLGCRASPPASARARARRARQPRRCHGGGEQRQWVRGRPREPRRGWLC